MAASVSRRRFLGQSASLGAGLVILAHPASARSYLANDKLKIAIAGVGGRGRANTDAVAGEEIVALCDVHDRHLAAATERYPQAQTYHDWRAMLDQEDVEAVVCSTTDHTHAPICVWAMERGMHVFCEKPLAHSVYEARVVQDVHAESDVATQHGTQIHAGENYRRVVELIRAGAVGPVREVHVWCGRVGPTPARLPEEPVPPYFHWDLWLGPAPERAFNSGYLGGCTVWEQYWDFGNGCLGDMGSHLIDLPFWALELGDPLSVEAQGEPRSEESYPNWLIARYEHPAHGDRPPLELTWYDGVQRPPSPPGHDLSEWGIGVLFVGDEGMLLADYNRRILLPEEKFADYEPPEPWIPASPGHHREWLLACKGEGEALCSFDYAGKLIEHNLLGTVAFRTDTRLRWDPAELKAGNAPAADAYIRRPYREGWTLRSA